MTPKSVRVSIFQQIMHEFRVVIRRALKGGSNLAEIEAEFMRLSAEGVKELTKFALALILLAVVSSGLSSDGRIQIKTSLMEVSLPLVYVAFAAAYLSFAIIIGAMMQGQYLAGQTIARFAAYDWRRFSLMDSVLRGNNQADVLSPIRNDHLYRLKPLPHVLSSLIFLLPIGAVMLPAIGAYGMFVSISFSEMISPSNVYLARPIAIASLLLQVMPLVYIAVFFLPFRIQKDQKTIRWRFLLSVHRRYGLKPSRIFDWLN
jgi:hypothetical protein